MKTLPAILSLHWIGVHMQSLSLITAGIQGSSNCGNEDSTEAKGKGYNEERGGEKHMECLGKKVNAVEKQQKKGRIKKI